MKKIFIAVFLLPFSLFAVDQFPDQLYRINVYQASSTFGNPTRSSLSYFMPIDSLFDWFMSNSFAIRFNSAGNLLLPEVPLSGTSNLLTNSTYTISYSVTGVDSCNYCTLKIVPELKSLYTFCARMFVSGLQKPFSSVTTNSSNQIQCNVIPVRVIADALVSTNTVYRSEALNYLSSINNSLSNIDTGVSSILSLLSNSSSPSFTASNVLESAEVLQSYANSNGFDLDLEKLAFDLDEDNYDSSPAGVSAFNAAVQSYGKGLEELSKLIGMASALNPSSPVDPRYNGLSQLGEAFNNSLNNSLSGLGGSTASLNTNLSNFARLSTNWQNQVKKDLQDWRDDTTNRLAHMFDSPVPIQGGNNSSPVVVSGAYGGPVGVAGTVHAVIDNLQIGVVIDKPVQIDSTQLNQISAGYSSIVDAITSFHDSFTDFTTSGNKPFNWISFYQLFYEFQNQSLTNQVALLRNLNYTNILENIYVAITNKDTNVVISAALLDDYENFVDTSKFSSIVSSLPDDLRDSLSRFGLLDSSDYSGRWWVFQAANMALQSQLALTNAALASLLSSSLQSLDDYFSDDEDPQSGLLSSWLKMIDGLPDPEELQQTISEATNIVSNVGLERVTVLYDRATNDFSSVVSSVYSDRSLPSTLSFVLIPGKNGSPDRVVNIPVSDRSSLWSFIRQGMAFGLSVVTLILFPKYLLWLLAHYTRLLEKIIKSLHAYTEH